MQTKEKSNSIVTHSLTDEGILTFRVRMGKDEYESFAFDPEKASEACRKRAMLHGFIQRISDGAALTRDPETGLPATPESKLARMKRLADHYESGAEEWSLKRAEGDGGPADGLIVTAMCRTLTGGDIDKANALVQGLADKKAIDRKAALRMWADTREVAAEIAKIRAERAKGDAQALIEELMGKVDEEEGNSEE